MNTIQRYTRILFGQLAMLWLVAGCSQASLIEVHQLAAKQAKTLIASHAGDPGFVILDVRTPKEFKRGRIGDAVLLDYHSPHFITGLKKLDKSKAYLIYCHTGYRSSRTIKMVKKMGFSKIYHLKNGIVEWQANRLPLVNP